MARVRTDAGAAFWHSLGRLMRAALEEGAGWDELRSALKKRGAQVDTMIARSVEPTDYAKTREMWK